jgi:hypothetical protein
VTARASKPKRFEVAFEDGQDRLYVVQQYADWPQYGLVFRVEHRTTGSRRAVLLQPGQVRELANELARWADR